MSRSRAVRGLNLQSTIWNLQWSAGCARQCRKVSQQSGNGWCSASLRPVLTRLRRKNRYDVPLFPKPTPIPSRTTSILPTSTPIRPTSVPASPTFRPILATSAPIRPGSARIPATSGPILATLNPILAGLGPVPAALGGVFAGLKRNTISHLARPKGSYPAGKELNPGGRNGARLLLPTGTAAFCC